MRRWVALCLLVPTLVAACESTDAKDVASKRTSTSAVATTTTALVSCDTIDGLAKAHYLSDALAALANNRTCDKDELLRHQLERDRGSVETLIARADAATRGKDRVAARAALLEAAALDAGDQKIRDGLAALAGPAATTTTVDSFAAAKRLDAAGYRTEAEAQVAEGLKTKPLPPDVTKRLDKHRGLWDWLKDNWRVIALFAAALAGRWLFRKLRKPRLVAGTGTGEDAAAISVLARSVLQRLDGVALPDGLQICGASDLAIDLPPLADVDKRLASVAAVLKWIVTPDNVTFAPLLLKHEDKGGQPAGVDLNFRKESLSTQWSVPQVKASSRAVQMMAAYTAGWVAISVSALPKLDKMYPNSDLAVEAGTIKAESLANQLAGVEAYKGGEFEAAETLFGRALASDADNWRARNNLAVAMATSGEVPLMTAASLILLDLGGPS